MVLAGTAESLCWPSSTSALVQEEEVLTRPCHFISVCVSLQEDEMLKQLQFFSVASDGRVTLWTLAKSELLHQVPFLSCSHGDRPQPLACHESA